MRPRERDLSSQEGPLEASIEMYGKSTEDPRNFPDVPGVINLIRG